MDASEHKSPVPLEFPGENMGVNWDDYYPGAHEEMDPKAPPPLGMKPMSTAVYFDSNWAHDESSRKSVTGCVTFIGNTPVAYFAKRQGAIATSTYSAEMCAAKMGAEEAVDVRYMLRSLGIPLTGPTLLIGDNLGQLVSTTSPGSECKKKTCAIYFHFVRECNAAGIVRLAKIPSEDNYSDCWTKALAKPLFSKHFDLLFYRK